MPPPVAHTVGGLLQLLLTQPLQLMVRFAGADPLRSGHPGQRGGFKADIFRCRQPAQHVIHRLVVKGIEPVEQALHCPANEPGRPADRQTVGRGQVINA